MKLTLYHYWRSSSSWRVRWALTLKKMPCAFVHIDLLSGAQGLPEHRARNPAGFVPALEVENQGKKFFLGESCAIIEWLEETQPQPPLLPHDTAQRARVRQLVQTINAGTQPIQNLNVLNEITARKIDRQDWATHWIDKGLSVYETLCAQTAGTYSLGDEITMADLFLIPQCYNALRFNMSLEKFANVNKIYTRALKTKPCQDSAPERFKP